MIKLIVALLVKHAAQTGAVERAQRGGWRMLAARVKRLARKMVLAPATGAARGLLVLPVGLLGQVSGAPSAPPKGAGLMQDALNWVLWFALTSCALAAAGGAGTIGVSRISGQVNHSNTGKQVLMGGLFGAAGVGLAIPLVNMLFAAAGR